MPLHVQHGTSRADQSARKGAEMHTAMPPRMPRLLHMATCRCCAEREHHVSTDRPDGIRDPPRLSTARSHFRLDAHTYVYWTRENVATARARNDATWQFSEIHRSHNRVVGNDTGAGPTDDCAAKNAPMHSSSGMESARCSLSFDKSHWNASDADAGAGAAEELAASNKIDFPTARSRALRTLHCIRRTNDPVPNEQNGRGEP